MGRIYTQDVLGDIYESPCRGTGQPAVFRFAVEFCILTGYHLGVYIRLGTMDLADILNVCGTGLTVDFEGSVTSAQNSFCDGYPGDCCGRRYRHSPCIRGDKRILHQVRGDTLCMQVVRS